MGVVDGVGYDIFPKQGSYKGKRVRVCFNYDTRKTVGGHCVRDDDEKPGVMIFALDDGRYVLSSECQYHQAD